jgi:hypothetical protein
MPGVVSGLRQNPIAMGFSLREVARHAPDFANAETLSALETDLLALNT